MSTESGKTCVECQIVWAGERYESGYQVVKPCKQHDGSMAEKLAEALRFAHGTHRFSYQEEACGICQLLAAYDELQGRKG